MDKSRVKMDKSGVKMDLSILNIGSIQYKIWINLVFNTRLLIRTAGHISLMLNDAYDHDVIIKVGKNQNINEFCAHSNILRARSPYFGGAFSAGWINKKDNMIEFKKSNVNP